MLVICKHVQQQNSCQKFKEYFSKNNFKTMMKHSILRLERVYHWQLRNKAHELFFNVVCKDLPFNIKVDMWQYFLNTQKSVFENALSIRMERLMIERLNMEFDKLPTKSKEVEAVCVYCYKENITKRELCNNCLRDLSKSEPSFLCHECDRLWKHTSCLETALSIISKSDSEGCCPTSNTSCCKNLIKKKILTYEKYQARLKLQDVRQQNYYKSKFVKYDYKNYDTVCRCLMYNKFTSSSGSVHN
ncbi:hypothetical protein [Parapoynx stagnalis nucleopolyhedrovirus]|uniref:Uncharacterized protein n=1 Tax=Parapoynx stagnalis nucleopolyhedrovirus TaxID=2993413 RepID=A0A9E8BWL1_9ABAC|nr:hypothetical protein [Parapoynx stagnalis nucleopolyhedrovirus]